MSGYHFKIKRSTFLIILLLILCNISCDERIFDNPFDPNASERLFEVVNIFNINPGATYSLTWDDAALWACYRDVSQFYKLDRLSGQIIRTLKSPVLYPIGIHYDNGYFYIIAENDNHIYKIDYYEGRILLSYELPLSRIRCITGDGTYLWIGDESSRQIYKINPDTGEIVQSFKYPGTKMDGIDYWSGELWISDSSSFAIIKLDTEGNIQEMYTAPGQIPRGLANDGVYLWNADGSGLLYQLNF